MITSIRTKIVKPWMVLLLAIPMLIGCGDGTRNDQGVAFTALGWFDTTVVGINQGAISSVSVPLAGDVEESGDSTSVVAYLGLQNNLSDQFIRAERAYHEYYIPGASVQPPSTSVAASALLGIGSDNRENQEFGADSSLPENFNDQNPDTVYPRVPVVTADVRSFINMNKGNMPEPPFVMVVTTYVEGVTSAGKRIKTNRVSFDVYWTPPVIVVPTANGGVNVESFDDEDY